MRTLIVSLIILFFAGCDQSVPDRRSFDAPPSGQGHYLDEDGVNRSVFKVVGTLAYGETRTLSAERGTLLGYTFFGQADDAPVIRLQTKSSATFSMALYGPQSTQGLWGNHLVERHGKSGVTLADFSLRNNGVYFVLIRIFGAESGMADIELTCDECEASHCQSIAACDVFCPNGRLSDQNGCPLCACSGGTCAVTGCHEGETCVFPCGRTLCEVGQACTDGRCVDEVCPMSCDPGDVCLDGQCEQRPYHCAAGQQLCEEACDGPEMPVCGFVEGSRRSFPSECRAECAGATEVMEGRCRDQCSAQLPCPEGQLCQAGRCISDACAQCPPPRRRDAVCGSDGETYGNRCLLECSSDAPEVAHEGACVAQCNRQSDCGFGSSCLPVPPAQIPSNREACREDPQGERCIRTCREIDVCSVGEPECRTGLGVNSMNQDQNGRNFSCYPTTRRAGICLSECDPSADNACGPYTCATVDAWGAEAPVQSSVCLVACEADADCPGQLQCRPDYRGVQVCQSCVCSSFESEPYCIQGTRFSNACELLCSGRRLQEATPLLEAEVCDGLDNDCDGSIDEDIGPQPCVDDECGSQKSCVDGRWSECQPRPLDVPEDCDGIDNDCDGLVDEGLRRRCGVSIGMCQAGQQQCQRGRWGQCRGAIEPMPEICGDGIDQDCDGRDLQCEAQDLDGDGFTEEQGDCDDTNPLIRPRQRELCDGVDQDCDGTVDEGVRRSDEVCDGRDNDCDGQIDEGDQEVMVGCVDEADDEEVCLAGAVTRALVRICGTREGQCTRGHEVCQGGRWSDCVGARQPTDEVCDQFDNDCDGIVDENPVAGGVMDPDRGAQICEPNCADCPRVWSPVCGVDGRLYASACHARCFTRQPSRDLSQCTNIRDEDRACEVDDDCEFAGQGIGLCVSQDSEINRSPEFGPFAECIARTSQCGCLNNRCGLRVGVNPERCAMAVGLD